MASNNKKQIQKRKARERRVRDQKIQRQQEQIRIQQDIRYRRGFPEFVYAANGADPDFVKLVGNAIQGIRLDDPRVFSELDIDFYGLLKRHGFQEVSGYFKEIQATLVESGCEEARFMQIDIPIRLGEAIFNRIPIEDLLRFIPYNDVRFVFQHNLIVARFDSLLQARGPAGTAFYSRFKPTLDIDGVPRIVAFSRHAIERICERIQPRWRHYAALGDVFAYFGNCIYFERCDLHGGQLGFTFYDICCDPLYWQYQYVRHVFGEENVIPDAGRCYYRVGYCPAVIEGDFIKATTLLFPGYLKTPEYGAILRSSLDQAARSRLIEVSRQLNADYISKNYDFSVLKWFHEHGVAQVVQMKQEVFRYA